LSAIRIFATPFFFDGKKRVFHLPAKTCQPWRLEAFTMCGAKTEESRVRFRVRVTVRVDGAVGPVEPLVVLVVSYMPYFGT